MKNWDDTTKLTAFTLTVWAFLLVFLVFGLFS